MISVLIAYLEANNKKDKWDDNNIKTRKQQDRYKTLLLLAMQEQRNVDTKIKIMEQNIDNS